MVQGFEQAQREYELRLAQGPDYFTKDDERYLTFDDLSDSNNYKKSLQVTKERLEYKPQEYIEYLENFVVEMLDWNDYLQRSKDEFIKLMYEWRDNYYELKKEMK